MNTHNAALADHIAVIIVILMAVGALFVFSAGVDVTQDLNLRQFYSYAPLRQLVFLPLAIFTMFFFARRDYHKLSFHNGLHKSPLPYLLFLSIALLILVLFLGTEVNHARRWLRIAIGPVTISFQPSELAKWVLLFFVCAYCARFADTLKSFLGKFLPICLIIGLIVGLVIIEDFGTAALIAMLCFVLLLIAGASKWHLLAPLPFAAAAFTFAILSSEARKMRILAFLHPDKWTDSYNYQANQSLIALGSGGILGKGLGMGICKYGHLPEDTTDFIFAIIGEELGLIGTVTIISLFIVFTWLGMLVVIRARDPFGQLLASSIVLAISVQAALNIGVVTVVLPTKGIPLPFVSSGGTSMLLSAAAVGILVNIARQTSPPQAHTELR